MKPYETLVYSLTCMFHIHTQIISKYAFQKKREQSLGIFLKEHKMGKGVSKGAEPIQGKAMMGVQKERPITAPTLVLSLQE